MDYQRYIDWADYQIVNRPGAVVLVFLVVTGVFMLGLGNVSTEAGTSQFTTGLPSEEALQEIDREFSPTFSRDTGSTQLIQHEQNVLSRGSMLRMLRAQKLMQDRDGMRVVGTSSAASIVARQLDPSARTLDDQIDAIEDAPSSEIKRAVREVDRRNPAFSGLLSRDYNRESATASATIGTVTHEVPAGLSAGAGQGGTSPLTAIQLEARHVIEPAGGNIDVFGTGLFASEFSEVIVDSLLIVVPAAVVFIVLFLAVAYRDPMDLLLGGVALLMAIIWTFGFMGIAGIAFSQMLIAVPPLLLAVGIDFGIHSVNRYREERVRGYSIAESMRLTSDQLLVAFFIVTGTTVIGFSANYTSELAPIRDFGLVASIGIVFVFLVFGVFMPAAKVKLDRLREVSPIPTVSERPLASEGSILGEVLYGGVLVARYAPTLFVLAVVVGSAGAGYYATGVDTTFEQEDFLPPEDIPDFLEELPEPFRPSEYTVTAQLNFLEEKFATTQQDQATVYLRAPMERDHVLESIHRAGREPPDTFVRDGRHADSESIVTVIQDYQQRDPEFRALVARNDRDDNGIPDQNLDEVYDYLLSSPAEAQTRSYLGDDRRSTRVVYSVESDAEQSAIVADAKAVADKHRYTAIATGQVVVFQEVSDLILESALVSLSTAIVGAAVFLVFIYRVLEGRASLGLANLFPVLVTVTLVAATMRAVGIPFNALTATILAVTIGLGVDYSVHITHRFADEIEQTDLLSALDRTVRGTGGALLGSMLTTVFGIGVLALAVFPAIGQFGVLMALSVFYAFVTSLLVLPPALVVWYRLTTRPRSLRRLLGPISVDPTPTPEPESDPDPTVD
ncbi:MAG: MMPL family transporter [Haloarculaceae archaeon]